MNQIYINMWKNSQSNFMKLIEKMKMRQWSYALRAYYQWFKIEIYLNFST